MANFTIEGPFEIPFVKRNGGGRTLNFDGFWTQNVILQSLSQKKGCYVFAIRNRGLLPVYVGKATKSFRQEVFNPSNRHKYNDGFAEYKKGTPLLYLVVHADQRGRVNQKEIKEIENFLIQAGSAKNPEIQNIHGAQTPAWSIKGVVRNGGGRPKQNEKDL